jgi:tRNA threonylcarbamoyladenosine biosynthesis protein TsaB
MPLFLSLDTSSDGCSVAVHDTEKLLGCLEIHEEYAHGAKLAVLIKSVLEECKIALKDLSAVGIASGPGSYTGLRIGTSTAKGLCYSLGIPLISADTLSVMALRAKKRERRAALMCPMLDARRMEVYCAIFDSDLKFVQPIQAKVIEEGAFGELLENSKIVFFGNGAEKCRGLLNHPNALFLENIYPSAVEVGELILKKFENRQFEDLVHFEPIYLKEFLIKKSTKTDSILNK